jgi:glycosyltransferase involved in cell wall biosynthesis
VSGRSRALVVAPFLSLNWSGNRPRVAAESLAATFDVDVLTSDWDHHRKTRQAPSAWSAIRDVIALNVPAYSKNVSLRRLLSHVVFGLRAARWVRQRRGEYELVYVTAPLNLTACVVCLTLSDARRVLDIVDLWPDSLPFPTWLRILGAPLFAVWRHLRRLACRHADAIVTVSDSFLAECGRFADGRPVTRIRLSHDAAVEDHEPAPEGECDIAFVGNIGHLYDFETLLDAIQTAPGVRLQIVGDGDRRGWLVRECTARGLRYEYHGVIYEGETLARLLRRCRVGFNGYRRTSATISYKAGTYFSAGLPILNSMGGDLAQVVKEEGLGANYRYGDAASLREALEDILCVDRIVWSERCRSWFMREMETARIRAQFRAVFEASKPPGDSLRDETADR